MFWLAFYAAAGVTGFLLVIRVIGLVVASIFKVGLDDSDYSAGRRSDLKIHTDALTGLQYLSTAKGSLHPRLYPDGTQVRVASKNEETAPKEGAS